MRTKFNLKSTERTKQIQEFTQNILRQAGRREIALGKCTISLLQEDGSYKTLSRLEALKHYGKPRKKVVKKSANNCIQCGTKLTRNNRNTKNLNWCRECI